MAETTNRTYAMNASKDFKKRFEFRLTVGENIICQRYFTINNFNPMCIYSTDLAEKLQECAECIDNDLKDKTQVYLELTAPKIFHSEEEMEKHFAKPENGARMHLGEGIIVKTSPVKYFVWGKNGSPRLLTEPFDRGDYSNPLSPDDWVEYKLAFYDNDVEVCAVGWTGCYPRAVRNSIDLANKKGRFNDEDVSRLSFDSYILYKMVQGKEDLVYKIIKEITTVCSYENARSYNTRWTYETNDGRKPDYNYDCASHKKELDEEYKILRNYLYGQTSR